MLSGLGLPHPCLRNGGPKAVFRYTEDLARYPEASMNLSRAKEKPLESHGQSSPAPGGVLDWQSDRLAQSLAKMDALFTTAFDEQRKHMPGTAEGLVQAQAVLEDIAQTAKNDPASRRGLVEASEEFVKKIEGANLPNMIKEGKDPAIIATLGASLAYVANAEFSKSTFYGISEDACKSEAKLTQMCERAHALVKSGYIGAKELEGVQVALADSQSVKARAADAFASITRNNGLREQVTSQEPGHSYFKDDFAKLIGGPSENKPSIHVNADQASVMGGTRDEAIGRVFSHELGHWLTRDKSPEILAAGVAAVKAEGGPNAAYLDQFVKPADLTAKTLDMAATSNGGILTQAIRPLALESGAVSVSWFKAVKEMQGDIMAVAAENAIGGKVAALAKAEDIASFRDKERLGDLAESSKLLSNSPEKAKLVEEGLDPSKVRLAEEHFTSHAVRDFADKIRGGELDAVKTPAQLDKLMGESVVRGLLSEYTQVRGAELNIHHVENGKILPGPPAGVDIKSVLVAEMANNLQHRVGEPTVLLTAEQAQGLPKGATAPTPNGRGEFNPAQAVSLTVQGSGPDATPTKFHLSSVAPAGMSMPQVSRGTQEIGGHKIADVLAPFAREILAGSREASSSLSLDKGQPHGGELSKPVGGEGISKAPGQTPAPEQKASSQPVAEMSM